MVHFIEPHKAEWKLGFENLKTVLSEALNGFEIDIQHVGSTAIFDLAAKPILDIDIIIEDKTLLKEISQKLEKIGYFNKGEQGIPGRTAFGQISEKTPEINDRKWQKHHLYVCFADGLALKNHLLFREALLKNQEWVEQYNNLKWSIVNQKGITKESYNKQKTDFIISILSRLGLNENELNEIALANK